ncbi:MAG TPA: class I SAM-dependent methyltransferase [Chryseolinea sp.]|nr:class I SAM-dependent methyltransferase [Chryseolinea sp.]
MKYYLMTFFATALTITTIAQDPWKDVYRESAWEQRDTWQRPEEIIKKLAIKSGSKVADIGCHEGYFTLKLAAVTGSEGRVYAVDVSRDKIEKLKRHLEDRNITNVNAIVGEQDNPRLPTAALDAVLVVDTYHEMDAHEEILKSIKSSLKPKGRLVLCEPISESRKDLSRADQERKHELGMNFALEDLKRAGFKILFQEAAFVDRLKEKGDKMWLIVCEK